MVDTNDCVFLLRTTQSSVIKTVVEGLKDLINDTNIEISQDGLQIITVDGKNCVIIHLKLVAKAFSTFHCSSNVTVGVNVKSLYTLLRTAGNNEVLTMYILRTPSGTDDYIHIIIENKDKKLKDVSKLRTMELNNHTFQIPQMEFNSVIKMSSGDFQKICKDLSNISDKVSIRSEADKLVMTTVDGDIGSKSITVMGNNDSVYFSKTTDTVVEDVYNIKYMLLFIRNSNLCTNVELFFSQGNPMVLLYHVASLGSLKFAVAPMVNPETR